MHPYHASIRLAAFHNHDTAMSQSQSPQPPLMYVHSVFCRQPARYGSVQLPTPAALSRVEDSSRLCRAVRRWRPERRHGLRECPITLAFFFSYMHTSEHSLAPIVRCLAVTPDDRVFCFREGRTGSCSIFRGVSRCQSCVLHLPTPLPACPLVSHRTRRSMEPPRKYRPLADKEMWHEAW